jgi:hypothetical protein
LLAERIDTRAIRLARIALVSDSLSAVRWKLPAAVQVGRDRAGPSSSATPRDDPSQGASANSRISELPGHFLFPGNGMSEWAIDAPDHGGNSN